MIVLNHGYVKYLLMTAFIIALYVIKIIRAIHIFLNADSACHKNNISKNLLKIDNNESACENTKKCSKIKKKLKNNGWK